MDLQQHYKSDWHRYNLKRREANLPMLNEIDFNARLEAALALRKEREGREERSGVDHWKDKNDTKKNKKKNNKKQLGKQHKRKPAFANNRREEQINISEDLQEEEEEEEDEDETTSSQAMDEDEEESPDINPSQSLFNNHISTSPKANLIYMEQHFSFFFPEKEYCDDLEGFLGYCNEKVRWGNICLYCQKSFKGTESVLKHMADKEHCKILYERGVDQEEFDVFYDFSKANNDSDKNDSAVVDDEEQWEDVSDEDDDANMKEGETEDDDDDDEMYEAYQEEIASQGFDITPLGELIFPDGRIVGHRGLARYYKQRFAPNRMERAAVRHAKEATGDRLYAGRVVNLYQSTEERQQTGEGGGSSSTALSTMGRMSGSIPTGRSGKGILVSGEGKGGFTSLSLYRYRAVVKKQRCDDARGQRLQYRSRMNMNKMGKKGNNISTGVITNGFAKMPR